MSMTEERKRELVQTTAASERLEDHEVDLYLHECEAKDVDPLSGLIVPQIRRSKQKDGSWKRRLTFVTTIDLMRAKADMTGDYAPGRPTEFTYGDSKSETPVSARAYIIKFVRDKPIEFCEEATWAEYYPGDGNQGAMWRKMPKVMLAKCSEGKGLRRGFPRALYRLYLKEEMDQAEAREANERSDDRALEDEKTRLERARDAMDQTSGSEEGEPQGLSTKEQEVLDGFVAGLSEIPRDDEDLEAGKTYVRGIDYGSATDFLKGSISKAYREWQGDRKRSAKQREGAGEEASA